MMKTVSLSIAVAIAIGITWISSSVANADLVIRNASDEVVSGGGSIGLGETVAIDPRLTQIQITNTDAVAVENLTGVFQGSAAADYSLVNLSATTIPPMSSVTATIRFTPNALGQRDASLVISSAAPVAVQASVSVRGTGGTVFAPIISGPNTYPVITQNWSGSYSFGEFTLGYRPTAEPIVIARVRSAAFAAPAQGIVYGNYNGTLYPFRYKVSAVGPAPTYLVTHTLSWFVGKADETFDTAQNARGGTLAIQADGKIILFGGSISIDGQERSRWVRLNPDGSVDSSFQLLLNAPVSSIVIDDKGKIFVAGYFTEVNGLPCVGVVKLHADGTVDETFVPMLASSALRMIVLPNGKVMLGTVSGTTGPVQRQQLVRLLPGGSVDPTFDMGMMPEGSGMPYTWGMAVQPDGKVLAGQVRLNGELVNFARFNTDGSVDSSFNCVIDSTVSAVVVQDDGKILVGGHFAKVNGVSRRCIVRLNSDGSVDTGFSPAAPYNDGFFQLAVSGIAIQADGRIVISGVFDGIGDQERGIPMARLYPDGTLDRSFDPGGSGERIESLAIDRTGAVFVTGVFTKIGGITRSGFAKLTSDPATSVLDFVDADSLRWTQSGTTPMLASAEFEVSTDSGVTWSSLGQGTRIAEGWQIDGVSLPSNGFLRARGRQFVSNRGFGEIGEIKLFGRELSPIEAWRQEKFATPLNHSDAANTFDADADGVPNLAEYGFGLDPRNPSSSQVPAWSLAGDGYVVSFQKPEGTGTLIHGAEWSQTMNPNDWHPAEDQSSGNGKSFRVPTDSRATLFFRLKVTEP